MRLTETETAAILGAMRRHFGTDVRVRLFGSRVDDSARGGDIDVFLDHVPLDAREVLARKLQVLAELHERLGERRIDIVVHRATGPDLAIHRVARNTGVELA